MNVALPEQRISQVVPDSRHGLQLVTGATGRELLALLTYCFPTGLALADTQVAQGQTGGRRPSLVVGLFCSLAYPFLY